MDVLRAHPWLTGLVVLVLSGAACFGSWVAGLVVFLALVVLLVLVPVLLRWRWGKSASDAFDSAFVGKILLPDKSEVEDLTRPGAPVWKVGLFGVDSSKEGRVLARGYVRSPLLEGLADQTRGKTWDLCVFLVHHHLLSIPGLEAKYQNDWKNLVNATCLVNSGRLLEALTSAHVDLVLHGHEHAHNWAGYSSVTPGRGPIRVVAAGSATGNDSFQGCQEDEATFNILILAPDRSVRVRRYFRQRGAWATEELLLLDAAALRHSRLRRAHAGARGAIDSEITKYLEFTRERDVWVYWVYTNWRLPKQEFVQLVRNSTGRPDKLQVQIRLPSPDRDPFTPKATAEPHPSEAHGWVLRWPVPDELRDYPWPVQINLAYRWRGGALLTAEELTAANGDRKLELVRQAGFEFAVARVPGDAASGDVAALEMIVSLPPEYLPPEGPIVHIEEGADRPEDELPELRQQLRVLAPWEFALRIPYPRKNRDYQLAWKPATESAVALHLGGGSDELAFRRAVAERGPALLESFAAVLRTTEFAQSATLALYVKGAAAELERKQVLGLGAEPGPDASPPPVVPLLGDRHALARAWWGEPLFVPRPRGGREARDGGFLEHEQILICLPIRFRLGTINPPSWGVIRVASTDSRLSIALTPPNTGDRVRLIMLRAMAALLQAALTLPGGREE